MTAQIGVINKKCVALATDSAVTRTDGDNCKSFNTAEKLFQLSKKVPVGIMIYNNASFLDVPWELIIKQYRKHIGDTKYDTLKEYCDDFFEFLLEVPLFNEEAKIDNVMQILFQHLKRILDSVSNNLIGPIDNETVKESILDFVTGYENYIDEQTNDLFEDMAYYEWLSSYDNNIKNMILNIINNDAVGLDDSEINKILECLKKSVLSDEYTSVMTGLVFAGYGEQEWFPSLYEFEIEGFLKDTLKYREIKTVNIGIADKTESAAIATFAQAEMAHSFLTGAHPEFIEDITDAIEDVCRPLTDKFKETLEHNNIECELDEQAEEIINTVGESICMTLENYISKVQKNKHVDPFLGMVDGLDKLQVAELAESLVSLTSFKRKMSMDTETVGGPIDVAVISKGEGFIWIKRKHYFDANLNPNYNNN